jgi:hypothetical protein
MKFFDYIFQLGDEERFYLNLTVTATSREQAVEKANYALAEPGESHSFFIGSPVRESFVTLNENNLRVSEADIVHESPCWLSNPAKAAEMLDALGYGWSGSTDSPWPEMLESGEGHWMKSLEDGESEGIYGFLKVDARPDYNLKDWAFSIKAWLYPGAMWLCSDGGIGYRVELSDAVGILREAELIEKLEAYEDKFVALIYALREADPKEGYPLSSGERQNGAIHGFTPNPLH